jgi:F0F1-type ATP synthase delta subunit
MNKKLLKQVVLISYKNGNLDNSVVSQVADKLSRQDLKQYIKALKNAEKLRNVYVESPFEMSKNLNETIKNTFPDKKIVNIKNQSLLVGTKIVYNDDVFEMSLKNSLDSIVENIENYD